MKLLYRGDPVPPDQMPICHPPTDCPHLHAITAYGVRWCRDCRYGWALTSRGPGVANPEGWLRDAKGPYCVMWA